MQEHVEFFDELQTLLKQYNAKIEITEEYDKNKEDNLLHISISFYDHPTQYIFPSCIDDESIKPTKVKV